MKIYKAVVKVKTNDGFFATHKFFGNMSAVEDFVDLLRSFYHVKINAVKVNVEFVGSLKDVN